MDPTPSMIVDSMFHSPEQLRADELVAKVTEEDLQWAKDAGRRRLLCLLLKGWFPVDFSPESAYDILAMGGLGKAGLLQSIVHECLQHPMTVVSCKPTDCALVLNRPCLRFKNINFKLAGFVRVDGSRYLKADAVQRYRDNVTSVPLVDELMDAAARGPDWRPFGPKIQRKGSWAFVDFAAMRARAHAPPDSPVPLGVPASRACLTPRLPCAAGCPPRHGGVLRHHALARRARAPQDGGKRGVPNPAQRRRRPNRVLPPSGAAQAVFCDFLEENLRPKLADQSDETVLLVDSDSERRRHRMTTSPSSPTSSSSRPCAWGGEGVEGEGRRAWRVVAKGGA